MECLGSMAVNGDESDFLQYTRGWLVKINRGGLFEVNDLAYQFSKKSKSTSKTNFSFSYSPHLSLYQEIPRQK